MRSDVLFFAALAALQAQSIIDPPEFSGTPKRASKEPTELQLAFALGLGDFKTPEAVPKISAFLAEHPSFAEGYFFRVLGEYCELKKPASDALLNDINKAIALNGPESFLAGQSADLYGMKARLEYDLGRFQASMDTIERGIMSSPAKANDVVNTGGVKPETRAEAASPCTWTQTEMDEFARRFPRDYRAPLYKGVYLSNLARFEHSLPPRAIAEFQKAITLNAKSALAHYFIGEVHTNAGFWTSAGDVAPDEVYDAARRRAVNEYTLAIGIDPQFKDAYAARANTYRGLKQHGAALRDYDKVIDLDPKDASALHDRALTRGELGNLIGSIVDYDEAIRLGTISEAGLPSAYQNRGQAHMKAGMFKEAVDDFSAIIELSLKGTTLLMNLQQYRALYPEFNSMTDAALAKKIHDRFEPRRDLAEYTKQLFERAPYKTYISDAYEKRMDAYLGAGRYRPALADYRRAVTGSNNEGQFIDRWRSIGKGKDGEVFIDIKTLELGTPAKLWMKTTKPKEYDLESLEIDCRGNKIRTVSALTYDDNGKVTNSLGLNTWQTIIPDSLGEQLHNATCKD